MIFFLKSEQNLIAFLRPVFEQNGHVIQHIGHQEATRAATTHHILLQHPPTIQVEQLQQQPIHMHIQPMQIQFRQQ